MALSASRVQTNPLILVFALLDDTVFGFRKDRIDHRVSVRRTTFRHYRIDGCAFDRRREEAELSSAAGPVAIRLNPFPPTRWW